MVSAQSYEGRCHCGAIGFVYRTALAPGEWTIRACQCGFCRAHASLSTSDPTGSLEFVERTRGAMHKYRFGQRTADFLLCGNCGVYIGAAMPSGNRHFGIINARVLHSLTESLPEATAMNYENEAPAERMARREKQWTPIAGVV